MPAVDGSASVEGSPGWRSVRWWPQPRRSATTATAPHLRRRTRSTSGSAADTHAWSALQSPRARAQQRRHLVERVGRIQEDDAELVAVAAPGGHVAASGSVGVAGLHPGDSLHAHEDERVVVVEVEVAALDGERESRVSGADYPTNARVGQVGAGQGGEVAGA